MSGRVKDYMTDISGIMVELNVPMINILSSMVKHPPHLVIVIDDNNKLGGIITGTDIIREIEKEVKSSTLLEGSAQFVMTSPVTCLPERTLMIEAVEQMHRRQLHTIVITKDDDETSPIGIITQMNITKWWLEQYHS